MSAIEALPPADRRGAERVHPASAIRATVGRGTGNVVDISRGGMRTRHSVPVMRGAQVRVTFEWQKERFDATAEVLASRVATLGDGSGAPTTFETRVRFTDMSQKSHELLERVVAAIRSGELRKWVANLHGWSDDSHHQEGGSDDGAFIRCRYTGLRWRTSWTHDPAQPENGFVVPATIRPKELQQLCETYQRADDDGRYLIRLMAKEAVGVKE